MAHRFSSADRLVAACVLAAASLIGSVFWGATVHAQAQTYTCTGGFGAVIGPFIPLSSLKTVPNPVIPKAPLTGVPTLRTDLAEYVFSLPAAIQLGKALFWDMQAGSDNKTACATCHFQAGADVRYVNQLNPGANGLFDGYGANYAFNSNGTDFPFVGSGRDVDNVAGSQGVRKSTFSGISKSGMELTTSVADPLFNVAGTNVRQVTGKNTPTVVNAVFNHRNFWNGRAQPEFNGVNPFGNRDTTARVFVRDSKGNPVPFRITIVNASLASQAVGPPLSDVEMSAGGRTFADIGKKLLLAKPLGLQQVSPTDSVLGSLVDTTTGKGLKVSYTTMIQAAFQQKWWNSSKNVTVNGKTYSMTAANFSLFWGLSVMLYEATLVSDDTPIDQYLALVGPTRPGPADATATVLDPLIARLLAEGIGVTRDEILNGLALFELPVAPPPSSFPAPAGFGLGCIGCHVGAETTSASIQNLTGPGLEPGDVAFKASGFDLRMERMFMQFPPVPVGTDAITFDPASYAVNIIRINGTPISPPRPARVATYDAGWYNLGVRPTEDDPGLDGIDPFGNALSWTRLFQGLLDPTFIKVPGNGLGCAGAGNATFPNELLNASGFPLLSGPLLKNEASDVAGTFKVPSLRNVDLTGPYFHTGGKATLSQVVEFYDNGGNFANPTKAPAIVPLHLTADQTSSLIAFLLALTDERVRQQRAPFDHPQLLIPNGADSSGNDSMLDVPAVGAGGGPIALPRFLGLNPFQF